MMRVHVTCLTKQFSNSISVNDIPKIDENLSRIQQFFSLVSSLFFSLLWRTLVICLVQLGRFYILSATYLKIPYNPPEALICHLNDAIKEHYTKKIWKKSFHCREWVGNHFKLINQIEKSWWNAMWDESSARWS